MSGLGEHNPLIQIPLGKWLSNSQLSWRGIICHREAYMIVSDLHNLKVLNVCYVAMEKYPKSSIVTKVFYSSSN